jgi:hypothetical protein
MLKSAPASNVDEVVSHAEPNAETVSTDEHVG